MCQQSKIVTSKNSRVVNCLQRVPKCIAETNLILTEDRRFREAKNEKTTQNHIMVGTNKVIPAAYSLQKQSCVVNCLQKVPKCIAKTKLILTEDRRLREAQTKRQHRTIL